MKKSMNMSGLIGGLLVIAVVIALGLYFLLVTAAAKKPVVAVRDFSVKAIQEELQPGGVLQKASNLSAVPVNTEPVVPASSGELGKSDIASFE
jgi:hypothetical protein